MAWLDLGPGDNDPIVLLKHLAAALDRLEPIAPELATEFSSPAPRVDDVVLPGLADELARLSPFELILDDVHELSHPRSLTALEFLLKEIPPGSQLVLLTRADPEVPLARQRVSGDLIEIRADWLAFDLDETRALAASGGVQLSERSLKVIDERIEGWPAGIALAMRAVDESAAGDAAVEDIAGTQRHIADYLLETVLVRETEEHRTFLLATSVLRRMTAPLCDAVLGSTRSSAVLGELEQSNSFIVPLDDHRGWYRYHQLFGEFLRAKLDRRHPGLAALYLARAAEWHEHDGADPEEAFRCAHECGDLERAGRVALASADGFVSHGQVETIRSWLLDCTSDEVGADPQLALAAASVYSLLGDGEKAQRFALDAERGDLDVPSADGATSLRSSVANVRSALGYRGIHQMLADAEFVYAAELETNTRGLVGGCRAIGIANVLLGRPDEAIAAFREALMLTSARPELTFVRIFCLGYLAFAAADAGTWSNTRKRAQEAKALVTEHRLDSMLPGMLAFTAKATALVHDGDLDRATHQLESARRLRHLVRGPRWLNADMNLRWGALSVDLGDRLSAHEHAGSARAALHGYPDPGTLPSRLTELEARIGRATDLDLTPAELRMLAFLPTHFTVNEIAARLHVSPATVKSHLHAIYTKLGVSTRSQAVEEMEQHGLEPGRAMNAAAR